MPPLQIRSLKKTSKEREELSQQQETQSNESSSQPKGASEEQSDSLTSSEVEKPKQEKTQPDESKEETDQDENQPAESKEETNQDENQPDESKAETTTRFFQAIGVIEGDVSFDKKMNAQVTVSGQTYPLIYLPRQKKKVRALQQHIKETGQPRQRLVVYPKAFHFPDPNQPHQIKFQFVRFETEKRKGASAELDHMEFQMAGLWQFIPVCRIPCLSIYKNFSSLRSKWIKKADVNKSVKFLKPAHLPVLWKEAPVKPFKYNPKAEEQEKPAFVKIKAKFDLDKNAFELVSLLEEPTTEEVPRFLKASKKEKKLAQQKQKEETNHHPASDQDAGQQSKEETTGEDGLSLEERINRIANQLENLSEIAQQNQGQQAELIIKQLITHGLKDDNYKLPRNYLSNWKHGRNVPKETSKHYSAYRLWQLITSHS